MAGNFILDEQPWLTQPGNTEDNPELLGPFTKVVTGPYRNVAFETEDVYGDEQTSNLERATCAVTANRVYVFYSYTVRRRNGDEITRETVRGAACAGIADGVVGNFARVPELDDLLNEVVDDSLFIYGARKHEEERIILTCTRNPGDTNPVRMAHIPVGGGGLLNPVAYAVEQVDQEYSIRLGFISRIISYPENPAAPACVSYLFDGSDYEITRQTENIEDAWLWSVGTYRFEDAARAGMQIEWPHSIQVLPFASTGNRLYCIVDSSFVEEREQAGGDIQRIPHRQVYQISAPIDADTGFADLEYGYSHGPLLTNTTEAEVEEGGVLDTFITSNRIYCVLGGTITNGVPKINLMWAPFSGGSDAYFSVREKISGWTESPVVIPWRVDMEGLTQVTSPYLFPRFAVSGSGRVYDRITESHGDGNFVLPFIFPRFRQGTICVRRKDGRLRFMLNIEIVYTDAEKGRIKHESVRRDPDDDDDDDGDGEYERRENGEPKEYERIEGVPGPLDEKRWQELGAKWGGKKARTFRSSFYYDGPGKSYIVNALDGKIELDVDYDMPFDVRGTAHVVSRPKLTVNYNLPPLVVTGMAQANRRLKLEADYMFPPLVVTGSAATRGRRKGLDIDYRFPPLDVTGDGRVRRVPAGCELAQCGMTGRALIRRFRELSQDEIEPYLWEDCFVLNMLNEAEREAADRAKLLYDDSLAVAVTVKAGKARYGIDPHIIDIERAALTADGDRRPPLRLKLFDRMELDWKTPPRSQFEAGLPWGRPFGLVFDGKHEVEIVPGPRRNGRLLLGVHRLPWLAFDLETEPEIPCVHHASLVDWALFRAFSIPDADEANEQLATFYLNRFEQYFGRRIDARKRRLQRANKPHVNKLW